MQCFTVILAMHCMQVRVREFGQLYYVSTRCLQMPGAFVLSSLPKKVHAGVIALSAVAAVAGVCSVQRLVLHMPFNGYYKLWLVY